MKEQFTHTDSEGVKRYYKDREMTILHREDGPAIECNSGTKFWYKNGKYHREDGPAIERVNGEKEWYIDDEELTEEGFNARMNPVEFNIDDIADYIGAWISIH